MTTRGQINSNFYQIVDVDVDGNPTQVKPEYVPAVSHADTANVANVANSVAVGNVVGIGNIATINLNGNSQQVLNGVGAWVEQTGGGGTPGGLNTQVQYNSNGAFAGSSNLTFNSTTSTLSATKFAGDAGSLSNVPGANVVGAVSSASYAVNAGYAITAGTANTVAGANVTGYVPNAVHANIANLANSVAGANVTGIVGNATHANISDVANSIAGANVTGIVGNAVHANVSDLANSVSVGNVTGIGNIATINLSGNGSQTLLGNGAWGSSPANVTPGGSNSYVQYNSNGAFAGSVELNFIPHPSNVEISDIATLNIGTDSSLVPSTQQGGKVRFVSPFTYSSIQRAPGGGLYISDAVTGGDETSRIVLDATTVHLGAFAGTVEVDSGISNVSLGNVDTLHIGGGTSGQVLTTDGAGTLTWADQTALTAVTVTGNSQPNITSLGNLTSMSLNNTVTPITANVGQMFWDTNEHTVTIGMDNGVQQQVGLESYVYVKASSAITDGQVVMFTGANGDNVTAAPANAASVGFKSDYIIGVATQSIALNGFGYITTTGKVHGLNTNAWNVGDILWYDPTSTTGQMTNVQPTDPQFQIQMAAVTKKSAGDGHIQVRVTAMTALTSITDVTITTPTTGQALIYNGSNVWVNGNPQQANIANVANSVAVANVVGIGNIATVNLNGSTSQVLYGNGVFANISANISSNYASYAGNITVNAQPNITSVGTLTSLTVSGNITAGNINGGNLVTANYHSGNGSLLTSITGANVTGYVANSVQANTVQTLVANTGGPYYIAGISSNTNGFANLQKNANIYYSPATGTITAPIFAGNLSGNANIALTVATTLDTSNASGQYITFVGGLGSNTVGQTVKTDAALVWLPSLNTLSTDSLTFSGSITGGQYTSNIVTGTAPFIVSSTTRVANLNVATAGVADSANSVAGANVTGVVANATYATTSGSTASATTAGTVTTNAQPNITSVGTLTSLSVSGNITSGNISGGNLVSANYHSGNGSLLSAITGANVTGTVANATFATTSGSATTAATVTTASQPNITSVGSLTGLTSTGVVNLTGSSNVSLGPVANVHITGGTSGYVLSTDGTGTLSWVAQSSGGTPGGANTYVQFNDGGVFGGVTNLTFDKVTNTLSATNFSGNGSGLSAITGANVTGTVANATYAVSAGSATTATSATTAGTVTTGNQPNITATGTLVELNVNGLTNLGPVGNVTITGGTNGYVLSTNGTGGLSWVSPPAAGATGSNTWVQYNNSGSFGSNVNFTFDSATNTLSVPLIAGTLTTAAQPNVTSLGTLSSLTVSGTINNGGGNIYAPSGVFTLGSGTIANIQLDTFNETYVSGGSVSGTITPDCTTGTIYKYTLTGGITLNSITNAVAGTSMTIILQQDATGSRTLTSTMKFANASKTLSTAANSIDIISVFYDGTTYYATLTKGYA